MANKRTSRPRQRALIAAAGGLLLAACGSTGDPSADADRDSAAVGEQVQETTGDELSPDRATFDEIAVDDPSLQVVGYSESSAVVVETAQIPSSERQDVPSGLDSYREPFAELPAPTIDLGVLRSGGPPPDGIPSIDDPVFHAAATVDYLSPTDPVVSLEINGDARAYPLDIMLWHELVNDTVGGVPVSVAYCPLCNSVTVYERTINGDVLDFGVSGLLYNSSLVMFDRQTETIWSHFTGQPLYGALGESELVALPATIAGFGAWAAEHPDGLVLSRDTGESRNYGANPYPGYDSVDSDPFLFEGDVDGRYTAMTRLVGVQDSADGEAVAFPLLELRDSGVKTATLNGEQIAAFWAPGATSALDQAQVSGGVDVGVTGVFKAQADGQALIFGSASADAGVGLFVDEQTGSTWNIFGKAIDGELAGTQLDQLTHIDTFWFAWIAFHPETVLAG